MVKVILPVLVTVLAFGSPAWGKRARARGQHASNLPALVMPPPLVMPPVRSQPALPAPPAMVYAPKPATVEAMMFSNTPLPVVSPVVAARTPAPDNAAPQAAPMAAPVPERAPAPPALRLEEPSPDPTGEAAIHRWMLGVKAGGILLSPNHGTSDSLALTLEGGYVLPVLDNHLQLYGSVGYANPHRTLTVQGANQIPGGASAMLTSQQLWITAGLLARVLPLDSRFNVYGFAGACVIGDFMHSSTRSGGSTIGTASESAIGVGGQGGLGIEIGLGPGKITLEGSITWVPTNSTLTGPMTSGGVAAQAGYRWTF